MSPGFRLKNTDVSAVTPIARVAIAPPPGATVESMVISPDGERVAFAAREAGGIHLWIQQLDSLAVERLPGTDGASFPFWSSKGDQVGFFASGRLKRIVIATREVADLAAAPRASVNVERTGRHRVRARSRRPADAPRSVRRRPRAGD
jgi:hypothetical protein